ncbi:hypothetical protein BOX30_08370 [Leptospirillum ferriphilum]|uniref:Uncharacterized protein n=2 Tax=Leptospirillum ferriphilum TaxID=178606 RepID=A0A059Y2E7_9BACT|nr:hypothetical protein Y981_05325 [Leptospirillum ferriphilum YSK]AKS23678.1 hypothetical protein ABH19_07900 [Leptospirillum sp. Group II 'CF-1']OOH75042.1 hypothetical protein BOX24_00440 [Leptospirillum ferriphilum]OOH78524.1 hypothetical protein BOX30_08370 [Leptospirillum ferriphilum]
MPDEHEDGKNMPHMECVFRRFFQTPVCPIWLQFLKSLYFPVFLRLVTSSFRVVLLDSRNSIRERALIYQKKEVYDTF